VVGAKSGKETAARIGESVLHVKQASIGTGGAGKCGTGVGADAVGTEAGGLTGHAAGEEVGAESSNDSAVSGGVTDEGGVGLCGEVATGLWGAGGGGVVG
jgi:hypothetical protein